MKRILKFFLVALVIVFSSCSKDKTVDEAVVMSQLVGTWVETYDDQSFSMDSYVTYTFYGDGKCDVYSRDAISGAEFTKSQSYMLEGNLLFLNPQMSDYSNVSYTVVKLDSKKMEWLKLGVKEPEALLGSDIKRFVRK